MIADFLELQKCYEAVQTAWDKFQCDDQRIEIEKKYTVEYKFELLNLQQTHASLWDQQEEVVRCY